MLPKNKNEEQISKNLWYTLYSPFSQTKQDLTRQKGLEIFKYPDLSPNQFERSESLNVLDDHSIALVKKLYGLFPGGDTIKKKAFYKTFFSAIDND